MFRLSPVLPSWAEFYKGRDTESYRQYMVTKYKPFFEKIVQLANTTSDNRWYYEVGAGTGNVTRILIDHYNVDSSRCAATELDRGMYAMLRRNLRHYPRVMVASRDAQFAPCWTYISVLHSHGMLEHMTDYEINKVIEASSVARNQVHYVPGAKYVTPSYGDERLMGSDEWHRICHPKEIIEFNDGYDYLLIF